MFCPLEYRDGILILRGLLILVIVVVIGVAVTHQQLSSLTQRQEEMDTVHVAYDRGKYSIQVLDAKYDVQAIYTIGQISNDDKKIIFKTLNHSIIIPTYFEVDCKQELVLLDGWANLLAKEAFHLKQVIGLSMNTLHERLTVYIRQFR